MGKISIDKLARYIIYYGDINHVDVTMSKLQKLLFFIQKEYIARTGELLFDEEFEAWDYGPIVPTIYYKYCNNGALPLHCYDRNDGGGLAEADALIVNEVLTKKINYNFPQLAKESMLEKVWQNCRESKWYRIIKNEELLKEYGYSNLE